MSSNVEQPRSQLGASRANAGSTKSGMDNIERTMQSSPSGRGKLPSRGAVTVTSLQDALKLHNIPGKGSNFSQHEQGLNMAARQSKSSSYFNKNQQPQYMDQDYAIDAEFIQAEDLLRQKQQQLLDNPQVKSSMTSNIKSIMQNQDKTLLTTSSRLLSS